MGSSPRMRGTPGSGEPPTTEHGIIPADAGNTRAKSLETMYGLDHPRVCGEHLWMPPTMPLTMGSSPRMRGTQMQDIGIDLSDGIIPAYAGNTESFERGNGSCGDHPRVCGEHERNGNRERLLPGSSPRMRGTRQAQTCALCLHGIIPAYAGNTLRRSSRPWLARDHPRVCGEHSSGTAFVAMAPGSSPRMRGTRPLCEPVRLDRGIIPAYAGNTSPVSWFTASIGDHPRVCGEHLYPSDSMTRGKGSSPRMRGTLHLPLDPVEPLGIIPAYAGNTRGFPLSEPMVRDHPRVCGEHGGQKRARHA